MNLSVCEAKKSRISLIKRCLRQPLLHFLIAGFALFVLYGDLHRSTVNQDPQRIEITPEVVQRIAISWLARWQRPASEQQLQGLIDEYVKEEILYREALKLGLDKDDTIIRRRLAQYREEIPWTVVSNFLTGLIDIFRAKPVCASQNLIGLTIPISSSASKRSGTSPLQQSIVGLIAVLRSSRMS